MRRLQSLRGSSEAANQTFGGIVPAKDPEGEKLMTATEVLQAASPEVRHAALLLLDEVSAPLTERELAAAFRGAGHGRLAARRMARALRTVDIIAVARRGS